MDVIEADHAPILHTHIKNVLRQRMPVIIATLTPKHRMPENIRDTNPLTLIAELHHTMLETEAQAVNRWL